MVNHPKLDYAHMMLLGIYWKTKVLSDEVRQLLLIEMKFTKFQIDDIDNTNLSPHTIALSTAFFGKS